MFQKSVHNLPALLFALFSLTFSTGCPATGTDCNENPDSAECQELMPTCAAGEVVADGACMRSCQRSQECGSVEACINGVCTLFASTCVGDNDCAQGWFCAGEVCRKSGDLGDACVMNNECFSGNCVDGLCCDQACDEGCLSCSGLETGNPDGICSAVSSGLDPKNACLGPLGCDGTGSCGGLENGVRCTENEQCESTLCVDGVCCTSTCQGNCEACDGVFTGQPSGTCAAVVDGGDPRDACAGDPVCDGQRSCRPITTPSSCTGGTYFCAASQTCVDSCEDCATAQFGCDETKTCIADCGGCAGAPFDCTTEFTCVDFCRACDEQPYQCNDTGSCVVDCQACGNKNLRCDNDASCVASCEGCTSAASRCPGTDICLTSCEVPYCGDGIVEGNEACDDGNGVITDGCPDGPLGNCQVATCGDGYVRAGFEGCDDGNGVNADACPDGPGETCVPAACGDGFLYVGVEACDDGNGINTDDCPDGEGGTCQAAACGDGHVEFGVEVCDDGNGITTDDCPDGAPGLCQGASCGDGFVQDGVESCDDGNGILTDDCPDGPGGTCMAAACGDGHVYAGVEVCDDGNGVTTDGCPDGPGGTCMTATCGDGFVYAGTETCDDGNGINTDACPDGPGGTCMTATCGDGFVQAGVEECEGSGTFSNGGCVGCTNTCSTGFGDCNQDIGADGCETNLLTNNLHCGGCGNDCYGGTCSAGVCQPVLSVTPTFEIDEVDVDGNHLLLSGVNPSPTTAIYDVDTRNLSIVGGFVLEFGTLAGDYIYGLSGNDLLRVDVNTGVSTVLAAGVGGGAIDIEYADGSAYIVELQSLREVEDAEFCGGPACSMATHSWNGFRATTFFDHFGQIFTVGWELTSPTTAQPRLGLLDTGTASLIPISDVLPNTAAGTAPWFAADNETGEVAHAYLDGGAWFWGNDPNCCVSALNCNASCFPDAYPLLTLRGGVFTRTDTFLYRQTLYATSLERVELATGTVTVFETAGALVYADRETVVYLKAPGPGSARDIMVLRPL